MAASRADKSFGFSTAHVEHGGSNNRSLESDGSEGSNDEAEENHSHTARRPRGKRACDGCRMKKIKCDRKRPRCNYCATHGSECTYDAPEQRRGRPRTGRQNTGPSNSLKDRVENIESLLQSHGLLGESAGGLFDALQDRLSENTNESHQQLEPNTQNAAVLDALADQMTSLITNKEGETRFIGSSSGFSIVSPKGMQWVDEKTGNNSFSRMVTAAVSEDRHGWDDWQPDVLDDLFARRVFKPLPSQADCLSLLRDFFDQFNQMFPLFHEPTFLHLVTRQYSNDPYKGSGWWASLNVALATAHRLRTVAGSDRSGEGNDHAWGYLKNAMAVSTELIVRNTDLFSVQALLGLALFLRGTSNPQPGFAFMSAGIRLAHSIGLHKQGGVFNFNRAESEQRNRVFWIAYLLDKDMSLRSGMSPLQDDDDMNINLPMEDPPDQVGTIFINQEGHQGPKISINFFRLICRFARIQSMVYKHLYSVKSSRKSDNDLLTTIERLESQLQAWKMSIPLSIRPDHDIEAKSTPVVLHAVTLHFAYYSCVNTVHRVALGQGYWSSRLQRTPEQHSPSIAPPSAQVQRSAELCANAARRSIDLVKFIPPGDHYWVWSILYYPVSALATIFTYILQYPKHDHVQEDLERISLVVAFLFQLEQHGIQGKSNIRRMLAMCKGFYQIAKSTVDKSANFDPGSERSGVKRKGNHCQRAARGNNAPDAAVSLGESRLPAPAADSASQSGYSHGRSTTQLHSFGLFDTHHQVPPEAPVQPSSAPQWAQNFQSGSQEVLQDSIMSDTNLDEFASMLNFTNLTSPLTSPFPPTENSYGSSASYGNSSAPTASMTAPGGIGDDGSSLPQPFTAAQRSPAMNKSVSDHHGQITIEAKNTHVPNASQDPWQMPMSLDWDSIDGMGMGWDFSDGMNLDPDLASWDTAAIDDMNFSLDYERGA